MNIKKVILIGAPIALTLLAIGTYYVVKKELLAPRHQKHEIKVEEEKPNLTFNIFPKLTSYQFYPYIRIEHGQAIFNEQFSAAVINKVIQDLKYVSGKVYWEVNQLTLQAFDFKFIWVPASLGQKSVSQIYHFTLGAPPI